MCFIKCLQYKFIDMADKLSVKNYYLRYARIFFRKMKAKAYAKSSDNYKELSEKYLAEAIECREWENKSKTANTKDIYFMWLQGMENAPDVVKRCYISLKQNCGNRNVILITHNNIFDFVTIPDFIMEKHRNGEISNTHFSDIVRCKLLIERGVLG